MTASRSARFHPLLRLLHWTMAALIIAMLFIGIGMVSTAGPAYTTLLFLHRPIGLALLVLVCVRIVARLAFGTPALPADLPPWQNFAAKASHMLLYLTMVMLPLIGWGMLSAGGYPVEMTDTLILPPILPQNIYLFGWLRAAHTVVAFLFFSLILGHLSAALFHFLIRRDGVFQTMAFGLRSWRPRAQLGGGASTLNDESRAGDATI